MLQSANSGLVRRRTFGFGLEEVLTLRNKGLTQTEIGERLGIGQRAVSAKLARLKKLSSDMGDAISRYGSRDVVLLGDAGAAIKANRVTYDITLAALARYIARDKGWVRRVETGKSKAVHSKVAPLIKEMVNPRSPMWKELAESAAVPTLQEVKTGGLTEKDMEAVNLKMAGMSTMEAAERLGMPAHVLHNRFLETAQASVEYVAGKQGVTENEAFRILVRNYDKRPARRPLPTTRNNTSVVIDLSYREEKLKIRKALLETVKERVRGDISGLTLPGTEWLLERDLIIHGLSSGRKVRIVGIERNPHTYENSRLNAESIEAVSPGSCTLVNDNVEDFVKGIGVLEDIPSAYNFVWLDWMGQNCRTDLATFKEMLGHLKLPAIFACTFMRCRDDKELQAIYDRCLKNIGSLPAAQTEAYPSTTVHGGAIPVILRSIVKDAGLSSEVIMNNSYREPGKAPMLLVALEIKK